MRTVEPVDAQVCETFQAAVELVGKRWTGAIISMLRPGPLRYTQLTQAVPGLSERLLSERLKELEVCGIVARTVLPGPPVGVEYALTEAGRDLGEAIDAIGAWGHRWIGSGKISAPAPRSAR
jgi:DNA-binding HxlR family transcriptional regulator